MGWFKQKQKNEYTEEGNWPDQNGLTVSVGNPGTTCARPMQSYDGMTGLMVDGNGQPNTIGYYARDYDHSPITYCRFATRWGDMQLKNGLANGVGFGRIFGYRGEGWYDVVVPTIPGQTRQYGGQLPGNYINKGPAPSQWQNWFNMTAGSQPNYPGGPGQVLGNMLDNPGAG
jgi:hypothetical protein